MIFKLWLHFVRKEGTLKTEDLSELFPYREDELKIWEEFIDENGQIKDKKRYAAMISSRL